jgi:hypothetical protein
VLGDGAVSLRRRGRREGREAESGKPEHKTGNVSEAVEAKHLGSPQADGVLPEEDAEAARSLPRF